jgi:hypothetical protein
MPLIHHACSRKAAATAAANVATTLFHNIKSPNLGYYLCVYFGVFQQQA